MYLLVYVLLVYVFLVYVLLVYVFGVVCSNFPFHISFRYCSAYGRNKRTHKV